MNKNINLFAKINDRFKRKIFLNDKKNLFYLMQYKFDRN